MFTAAGKTLKQQYPAGIQAKGKSKFAKNTFHLLHRPLASIRILKNTSISREFISSKNQANAQCWHSKTFCKELAKTDKQSYASRYKKRLGDLFHFAFKAIKGTKFVSLYEKCDRPGKSGRPEQAEGGCHSSFGSQ